MCPLAKEELGQLGLRASNRQIQDVGEEPGLKLRRRPTGQHTKNAVRQVKPAVIVMLIGAAILALVAIGLFRTGPG
jgi:hypothetical protein